MEIQKVGCLSKLKVWEDFLKSLPQNAEGQEDLGKMWQYDDPPAGAWHDPIVKQGWRLALYSGVQFRIPHESMRYQVEAQRSPTGRSYWTVLTNGTALFLHQNDDIASQTLVGDVHLCARVFWPKDAENRNCGKSAWKNYLFFLDVFPVREAQVRKKLEIWPENSKRKPLYMFGLEGTIQTEPEIEAVAWATRSTNWWPAIGSKSSAGIDQLITFSNL